MITDTRRPSPRREVEIVHPSYQPSKAELKEDMRVEALCQPVRIRYVPRSKKQVP